MEFLVGFLFGLLIGIIMGFITFAILLNDGMKRLGLSLGIEYVEFKKEEEM